MLHSGAACAILASGTNRHYVSEGVAHRNETRSGTWGAKRVIVVNAPLEKSNREPSTSAEASVNAGDISVENIDVNSGQITQGMSVVGMPLPAARRSQEAPGETSDGVMDEVYEEDMVQGDSFTIFTGQEPDLAVQGRRVGLPASPQGAVTPSVPENAILITKDRAEPNEASEAKVDKDCFQPLNISAMASSILQQPVLSIPTIGSMVSDVLSFSQNIGVMTEHGAQLKKDLIPLLWQVVNTFSAHSGRNRHPRLPLDGDADQLKFMHRYCMMLKRLCEDQITLVDDVVSLVHFRRQHQIMEMDKELGPYIDNLLGHVAQNGVSDLNDISSCISNICCLLAPGNVNPEATHQGNEQGLFGSQFARQHIWIHNPKCFLDNVMDIEAFPASGISRNLSQAGLPSPSNMPCHGEANRSSLGPGQSLDAQSSSANIYPLYPRTCSGQNEAESINANGGKNEVKKEVCFDESSVTTPRRIALVHAIDLPGDQTQRSDANKHCSPAHELNGVHNQCHSDHQLVDPQSCKFLQGTGDHSLVTNNVTSTLPVITHVFSLRAADGGTGVFNSPECALHVPQSAKDAGVSLGEIYVPEGTGSTAENYKWAKFPTLQKIMQTRPTYSPSISKSTSQTTTHWMTMGAEMNQCKTSPASSHISMTVEGKQNFKINRKNVPPPDNLASSSTRKIDHSNKIRSDFVCTMQRTITAKLRSSRPTQIVIDGQNNPQQQNVESPNKEHRQNSKLKKGTAKSAGQTTIGPNSEKITPNSAKSVQQKPTGTPGGSPSGIPVRLGTRSAGCQDAAWRSRSTEQTEEEHPNGRRSSLVQCRMLTDAHQLRNKKANSRESTESSSQTPKNEKKQRRTSGIPLRSPNLPKTPEDLPCDIRGVTHKEKDTIQREPRKAKEVLACAQDLEEDGKPILIRQSRQQSAWRGNSLDDAGVRQLRSHTKDRQRGYSKTNTQFRRASSKNDLEKASTNQKISGLVVNKKQAQKEKNELIKEHDYDAKHFGKKITDSGSQMQTKEQTWHRIHEDKPCAVRSSARVKSHKGESKCRAELSISPGNDSSEILAHQHQGMTPKELEGYVGATIGEKEPKTKVASNRTKKLQTSSPYKIILKLEGNAANINAHADTEIVASIAQKAHQVHQPLKTRGQRITKQKKGRDHCTSPDEASIQAVVPTAEGGELKVNSKGSLQKLQEGRSTNAEVNKNEEAGNQREDVSEATMVHQLKVEYLQAFGLSPKDKTQGNSEGISSNVKLSGTRDKNNNSVEPDDKSKDGVSLSNQESLKVHVAGEILSVTRPIENELAESVPVLEDVPLDTEQTKVALESNKSSLTSEATCTDLEKREHPGKRSSFEEKDGNVAGHTIPEQAVEVTPPSKNSFPTESVCTLELLPHTASELMGTGTEHLTTGVRVTAMPQIISSTVSEVVESTTSLPIRTQVSMPLEISPSVHKEDAKPSRPVRRRNAANFNMMPLPEGLVTHLANMKINASNSVTASNMAYHLSLGDTLAIIPVQIDDQGQVIFSTEAQPAMGVIPLSAQRSMDRMMAMNIVPHTAQPTKTPTDVGDGIGKQLVPNLKTVIPSTSISLSAGQWVSAQVVGTETVKMDSRQVPGKKVPDQAPIAYVAETKSATGNNHQPASIKESRHSADSGIKMTTELWQTGMKAAISDGDQSRRNIAVQLNGIPSESHTTGGSKVKSTAKGPELKSKPAVLNSDCRNVAQTDANVHRNAVHCVNLSPNSPVADKAKECPQEETGLRNAACTLTPMVPCVTDANSAHNAKPTIHHTGSRETCNAPAQFALNADPQMVPAASCAPQTLISSQKRSPSQNARRIPMPPFPVRIAPRPIRPFIETVPRRHMGPPVQVPMRLLFTGGSVVPMYAAPRQPAVMAAKNNHHFQQNKASPPGCPRGPPPVDYGWISVSANPLQLNVGVPISNTPNVTNETCEALSSKSSSSSVARQGVQTAEMRTTLQVVSKPLVICPILSTTAPGASHVGQTCANPLPPTPTDTQAAAGSEIEGSVDATIMPQDTGSQTPGKTFGATNVQQEYHQLASSGKSDAALSSATSSSSNCNTKTHCSEHVTTVGKPQSTCPVKTETAEALAKIKTCNIVQPDAKAAGTCTPSKDTMVTTSATKIESEEKNPAAARLVTTEPEHDIQTVLLSPTASKGSLQVSNTLTPPAVSGTVSSDSVQAERTTAPLASTVNPSTTAHSKAGTEVRPLENHQSSQSEARATVTSDQIGSNDAHDDAVSKAKLPSDKESKSQDMGTMVPTRVGADALRVLLQNMQKNIASLSKSLASSISKESPQLEKPSQDHQPGISADVLQKSAEERNVFESLIADLPSLSHYQHVQQDADQCCPDIDDVSHLKRVSLESNLDGNRDEWGTVNNNGREETVISMNIQDNAEETLERSDDDHTQHLSGCQQVCLEGKPSHGDPLRGKSCREASSAVHGQGLSTEPESDAIIALSSASASEEYIDACSSASLLDSRSDSDILVIDIPYNDAKSYPHRGGQCQSREHSSRQQHQNTTKQIGKVLETLSQSMSGDRPELFPPSMRRTRNSLSSWLFSYGSTPPDPVTTPNLDILSVSSTKSQNTRNNPFLQTPNNPNGSRKAQTGCKNKGDLIKPKDKQEQNKDGSQNRQSIQQKQKESSTSRTAASQCNKQCNSTQRRIEKRPARKRTPQGGSSRKVTAATLDLKASAGPSTSGKRKTMNPGENCDTNPRPSKKRKLSKRLFEVSPEEIIAPANKRGFQYRNECFSVLDPVYNHPLSEPFRAEVPDYHKIVKLPMCLDMIASRLRQRLYTNLDDFVSDARRIFWNCRLYNKPGSVILRDCAIVESVFNRHLQEKFKDRNFSHINGSPKYLAGPLANNFRQAAPGSETSTMTRMHNGADEDFVSPSKIPGELKQLFG